MSPLLPNHRSALDSAILSGCNLSRHWRGAREPGRSVRKLAVISCMSGIAVFASSCASKIAEGKASQLARQFVVQQGHTEAEPLAIGISSDRYTYVYEINGEQVEVAVDRKTGHVGFNEDSH
jgi:hypothetical protein